MDEATKLMLTMTGDGESRNGWNRVGGVISDTPGQLAMRSGNEQGKQHTR